MKLVVSFFLFFVFVFESKAQLSISGPADACIGDLLSYNAVFTGTASTYDWNFGTYGKSSNASPIITPTAAGTVNISLTVTLKGGSKLSATKSVLVHNSPTASMTTDPSSDFCGKSNRICFKNNSKIADAAITKITVLWFDGTTSKGTTPLPMFCRSFPGAGKYTYNLEVEDSFGCKGKAALSVTVNPQPDMSTITSTTDYCDSIQYCWKASEKGGSQFTYNWKKLPEKATISNTNTACYTVKAGQSKSIKLYGKNEFGCMDSTSLSCNAPIRKFSAGINKKKLCYNQLDSGFGTANEVCLWTLNGKPAGTAQNMYFKGARPGWNYVYARQIPPCKSEYKDSFFVTQVVASGVAYNADRIKVIDTVFFENKSHGSPGTKLGIFWDFGDDATNCINDRAHGKNMFENCNYSVDQIARHYYHNEKCFVAHLYVVDSVTGCKSDTAFDVFRSEFCDSFITKHVICLGEQELFKESKFTRLRGGKNVKFKPDTKDNWAWFDFIYTTEYYISYPTVGFKSPVYYRFYNRDTVWKESRGKIVIDSFRNVGLKIDTFKNAIQVVYKPNAKFTLIADSGCNPYRTTLKFKDSFWYNADSIVVDWGDKTDIIHGFKGTKDTFPILHHNYYGSGRYKVYVSLYPKGGCTSSFSLSWGTGISLHFTPKTSCNWRNLCIADTITDNRTSTTLYPGDGKMNWDFGNGLTDSNHLPCTKYSIPGTYKITLRYTSPSGCTDSLSKSVTLSGPVAAIKNPPLIYCSTLNSFFDSSWYSGNSNNDKIATRIWSFGDGSNPVYGLNPSHLYPSGGKYTIQLIVITNFGCRDTAYFPLKVLGPVIQASLASDSAGCAPLYVKFKNESTQCGNFIWQFGDAENHIYSTQKDSSVGFTYSKSGVYFAKLVGGDSFYNPNTKSRYYCTATWPGPNDPLLRIEVYPKAIADFSLPDSVCTNSYVTVKNLSSDTNASYKWILENLDTTILPLQDKLYHMQKSGTYPLHLYTSVPQGGRSCPDTANGQIRVVMHQLKFSENCKKSKAPALFIENHSGPIADIYRWHEMDMQDSSLTFLSGSRDLNNYFLDSGTHHICLYSSDTAYCQMPSCRDFVIHNHIRLANVFTPGTDGFNDVFRVPFAGYSGYHLSIFNRYGELVFNSSKPGENWNGKVQNSGAELPSGSYFYQLQFQEPCKEKPTEISGSITLLR